MDRITIFAQVLLPLPVPGYFTYRVPYEMNEAVKVGQRVIVQFGRKKIYTALIRELNQTAPDYAPKYISAILDEFPIVTEKQFCFWEWIATYYMCTVGEVMNAALPQGLKLISESQIILHPSFIPDQIVLNENEFIITEALLARKKITISEVTQLTGLQKTIPLLKTMIDKNLIIVVEELNEEFLPKLITYIRITKEYSEDELKLREAFETLSKRAFKQVQLLMSLINLSQNRGKGKEEVKQSELLKSVDASVAQLNALVEKGILQKYQKLSSRLLSTDATNKISSIELSESQCTAFDQINTIFEEKDVVLLHGVTSSGKTEIYIKLIDETIKKGKQVLYLLPEIALTTQIITRLQKYFGAAVGVYHSRYNKHERVEIWNKVTQKSGIEEPPYKIIIGPRSALFLPFENLGLIIVDEEHDNSYKQFDPAPRYNARDSAIYLGGLHSAKTLLGSATPSIETYYNASHQKYGLVELNDRYGNISMPEILVADIKDATKKKQMHSHFSSFLLKHIDEALENKEQVILFQNRRGFSLRLECDVCNWIPECIRCDVTLTYHKHSDHLRCHYCGYSTKIPEKCPNCGNPKVLMKGFGTEKVEEELALLYPKIRIMRMDLDTTRSKYAYQKIITDFENNAIDILVGTQMVTKGLDFDNVSVVGILNADNMLSYPDFRSPERSYQMMAQVSGRAGRKNKRGKVIIQTYNPYHSVIRDVIDNNYAKTYKDIIQERINFKYPPFYRLIEIRLKHKDYNILNAASAELANKLRAHFGELVLGPEYPMVSRIKNLYIKHILLKTEKTNALGKAKLELKEILDQFNKNRKFTGVSMIIDVDPQ
ncbi:MAG: primosomal protein N' [Bacteroidetes bacterium]|nr:primosomal protein N' [Bacteroidota bacterium]